GQLDEAERVLDALKDEASAHRARLMLARLHARRGRMAEAEPMFMRLIGAYNDESIPRGDAEGLAYVAMAAWGLGSAHDANDAFRESAQADGERVETQLEWARLFLAKYDTGHAEESVRDALRVNPEHPVAHALMARIKIEQSFDFAAAEEHVDRALAVNPNLVMAHVTRAGMALRDLDIEGADAHLDRALAIDAHDLEALSVRAAVRYLADDEEGFEAAKREVLRRHRTYSELYTILGEFAEWEHRYPDIVEMAREAVTLNPEDYRAHAMLGLNLLRMGDEEAALPALQSAWRRDRFNVRVYNTLNLYEEVIPQHYEVFEAAPFTFRMHEEERPILERYVPRTLQTAYRDMVRRYGFTPEGPLRIEMFASTQHFSVRTTGLPNLGVQGVCFGKVVTAISPEGGPFNWGQITWHELAHVFHIQLSQNRVPRWFTEGLAEYETLITPNEWRREMDHHLWEALQDDRLPPLRLMNRAFTHARSAMDMMVAYYASTRIVKYIADEFGFEKVVRMLREWGAGRPTVEVVQRSLGISVDQLDERFRAHARRRLSGRGEDFSVDFAAFRELEPLQQAAQAAPQDAAKQASLAAGLLVNGDPQGAQQAAERAVAIEAGQPVARYILARLALMQQDGQGAQAHLEALVSGGHDGYELRLLMARAALGQGDQAAARTALEAATQRDGDRPEAWQGLAEIAEQANDADLRLRALGALARIDEHGRAVHAEYLDLLVRREAWDDAVRAGELAVFAAPANPEVHAHLARAYLAKGRHREALYEADSALIVQHPQPGYVHLLRARAFQGLGQRREAREAAEAARQADPELAEQAAEITGG
ncbi:MAG TPA: tetratricopeptide repeat protein, partial [Polyangiaceae bacterium LLY-WYZ-15_(1-7)]|nr:tetratricopeptide repeat protein [Polyangiaceae bacterium LLY-WYZ-15_(1-7)]